MNGTPPTGISVGGWKVHPMKVIHSKLPPTGRALLLGLNRGLDAALTENMTANS